MRSQDIVILLKKISSDRLLKTNKQIADELSISASEVSEALERCRIAKLVSNDKKRVNTLALEEFLFHGLKYVYPVEPLSLTRGIPTAVSAPPLNEKISCSEEKYVWPDPNGDYRGFAITPLYKTVPQSAVIDLNLYKLLALVDVMRFGRPREIQLAQVELKKLFNEYA